jgi:NAD(P)-dependent dehydrogenase (short-subunit alcohol dehydrogenase family)
MSDTFFRNKIAVVTGAGGTLCSAVAQDLAARGARVALVGRTLAKLESVAAEILAAGGTALPVAADVTDRQAVEQVRTIVEQALGPCTLLVNGAGGNQSEAVTSTTEFTPAELAADKPDALRGFFNLDLDHFQSVIYANTLGTVVPCQVFGRTMAQAGQGAIVNFASMNSYRPLTRVPAYGMAKAGVVNFTQWLAVYLAPAGIRVNAVAPGFFVNDRSRKILFDEAGALTGRGQNVMAHTPVGRFGQPRDLLGCVRWLLNDADAAFVTGITVPVDGGFLASSGV